MAELTVTEIRKTIATSLGTAFGIVIGMVWTQVVLSVFGAAGIPLAAPGGWVQLSYFVITAIIVTIVCVVAIVMLGKWGGKAK